MVFCMNDLRIHQFSSNTTSMVPAAAAFLLVVVLVFLTCLTSLSFAQLLPQEEVQALETISAKLQYTEWSVTRMSCQDKNAFNKTISDGIYSNVTCDCSFNNNTLCHIVLIEMKGLNLTGTLPAEIANLPFLNALDLSRNYINGSIPADFSLLRNLTTLSLLGNRLSGAIPEEIGDMNSLQLLNLEDNLLGGSLPPSLGRIGNLSRLMLSANNFSGPIPETYGNLKNLTDLRIDGNAISGKIPDFIGNWANMIRLDMQGTQLERPIPSSIAKFNLKNLRIHGLNGMSFPNLEGMNLNTLILRNCSIIGAIPPYLGDMINLKNLDLSINSLTGKIPNTFSLENIDNMFISSNSLIGEIPQSFLNQGENIDLSYNNFTMNTPPSCSSSRVNLVSSFSSSTSNSISWCIKKDLPCSGKAQYYSLFINCGGLRIESHGNTYEEDRSNGGPSYFFSSAEKWAYSSTGLFMGKARAKYIATNSFGLNITGEDLYKTARLAPSSLKYYGLCLRKGTYRVRLHFAEIMYSNDSTFSSIGMRIFDVSIQGKVVLRDFNIMERAGGVGIGIFEEFNVLVNGSTLEIHLYWTGKGTNAIPDRGVYGPLISAITVTPNFDTSSGLSVATISGIVVASCILVLLILVVLWKKGYLGGKSAEDQELKALNLQTGHFTLRHIKAATSNFDPVNKIGEGGFGPVYKGVLPDGTVIAVKQLSAKSKQGNREFITEIGMISALHHPNLVKLHGCCIEGNQLMLIYEYLENNSLARALFGDKQQKHLNLKWETRKKICLGIAKGLAYLHEESLIKIIHRDIKATNVLLDKDLNAKISDFGLAKLSEDENTHISTRIAGTIGYMAPEYAMRGYLTDKADVYSFGVVTLEIVSGKSNTNYKPKEEFVYLLDWAYVLQEQGNLLELVDPNLGAQLSTKEAMIMLNVALLCTNPSPTLRPSMSSVVMMLDGKIPVQAPLVKRNAGMGMGADARFKSFETSSQDSQTDISAKSHRSLGQRSISDKGPWMDSSSFPFSSKDEASYRSSIEDYNRLVTHTPRVSTDDSNISLEIEKLL